MRKAELPRFLQLSSALQKFVTVEGTQAQLHIRPLHQYLTVRLVLEGGFVPVRLRLIRRYELKAKARAKS